MKLAALQFGARLYAAEQNRAVIGEMAGAELAAGADIVVLPELAVPGYGLDRDGLLASAEPSDGPTAALLQGLAERHGAVIVCGFCEREGDALYNSAVLARPGRPPAIYRKLHLFDAERDVFTPGDTGLVIAETSLGAVGICVCYDLRFVEVARAYALAGADLLAVPTAWVGGFDKAPRDEGGFIGQARGAIVQANLNQLPMICASQSGRAGATRFLGSSLIADAFGACVAGPLGEDEEGVLRAEMTLEGIRAARIRSPRVRPREDRRSDVYGLTATVRAV
jgi:predicted amidohydrolase